MSRHRGRLELTWTNKDQRLLAREDGGYEWVAPGDHRVREVRLLHDAGTIGAVGPDRARDNLLIRGDALHALTSLVELPEFRDELVGKVKLIYIDPPFNTGQAFAQYDDGLEHSVWLTMMRDRLMQLKTLLSPDGSIWVHLDDAEMAYCRVLMDEIFGRENFVATVVWEKVYAPKSSARHLSTDQDYLLLYAREAARWKPNAMPRSELASNRYRNPDSDVRGPWKPGSLDARNYYSRGSYTIAGPTGRTFNPPPGAYWRVSEERFRAMNADNRIWWGPTGTNVPAIKRFLSEVREGVVPRTLWHYAEVGHTQEAKREIKAVISGPEPFATPKPERLILRVLQIATKAGDIVFDCFAGSGTTAAVAHKMNRRWVTIESSRATVETYASPRLEKVVNGADPGGITDQVAWKGGGRISGARRRTVDVRGGRRHRRARRVGNQRPPCRGDRRPARV